jgi:hypothetical protein
MMVLRRPDDACEIRSEIPRASIQLEAYWAAYSKLFVTGTQTHTPPSVYY